MNIQWTCSRFSTLNAHELYEILALRQDVFVMEQTCLYNDIDGIDVHSLHVRGIVENQLIAYARIIPSHADKVHLGRILIKQEWRGKQLGIQLVNYALSTAKEVYAPKEICIAAQAYLKTFYESFGFRSITDEYDLDGIKHIDMNLITP